jgi:hypothetical protein
MLLPGAQSASGLVRISNPEIQVTGTAELMPCQYPIQAAQREDGSWAWEYTGGESKDYYEESRQERDEDSGEWLFYDENGEQVPLSDVAVRVDNEDGDTFTLVPLKAAE